MPCSGKRAGKLLKRGRARLHRREPFTIRLTDRLLDDSVLQPLQLKIDPGSKVTGAALVRVSSPGAEGSGPEVVEIASFELENRGELIKRNMTRRKGYRRRRRSKNLRYRKPRFQNRRGKKGRLPPSLLHRVDVVGNFAAKILRLAPLAGFALETARFDMQRMRNPDISGVEYQQGELQGYVARQYLLEREGGKCAYCGKKSGRLEVDHIVPKARGGSDRVSNLTLACRACNLEKGARDVKDFLTGRPEVLRRVTANARATLKDAAAVNSTRKSLLARLAGFGLPVEEAYGYRTSYNRARFRLGKSHSVDAACVGTVSGVTITSREVLAVKSRGRGRRQRTQTDRQGFPVAFRMREKSVRGFRTGDLAKAEVTRGKRQGRWIGRVIVRKSGYFDLSAKDGKVCGISWKNFSLLQRNDGYEYSRRPRTAQDRKGQDPEGGRLPEENRGVTSPCAFCKPNVS
jgi:hypothetical protein